MFCYLQINGACVGVTANSRHCDCVNQRIAGDSKEHVIIVQEPASSRMTTSAEACAAT
jgi:hypothetical protein